MATNYATNVYTRKLPKLPLAMDGCATKVILYARGVQQGYNLGPLCYRAGYLKFIREIQTNPPVPGGPALAFMNDIAVHLLPENTWDTTAIAEVMP